MSSQLVQPPAGPPWYPGMVQSPYGQFMQGSVAVRTANVIFLSRHVMPKTGVLRDLSYYCGAPAGNVAVMVYDLGAASAGNHTRLDSLAPVVAGTAGAWNIAGDPALPVKAGDQLLFGIQFDNGGTMTTMAVSGLVSGAGLLPASFAPAPGGLPARFSAQNSPGSFTQPASIPQGSVVDPAAGGVVIMARVS